MGKYRLRPVMIDAWRWISGTGPKEDDPDWLRTARARWPEVGGIAFELDHPAGARIAIATLEGDDRSRDRSRKSRWWRPVAIALPGDWIIRGVKGDLHPCKPDEFEATYEPVADDEPA
ncbi:MAG TPA: hypothetical protein VIH26_07970 [Anaerolineales bacterium]